MTKSPQKLSEKVTIINELGLHARSAAMVTKVAQRAQAQVWIERNGERVDAGSIMDLLTLACPKGTELIVAIDDPADMEILEDIVKLVKDGFGEQVPHATPGK